MRILIFNWRDLDHPDAGGAEVYTQNVAREWVRNGHKVTLFCSEVKGKSMEDRRDGVRIIRRGTRHSVYRQAERFYESEGRGQFDLVVDEINTRPFRCPEFVKEAPVVALIHQVAKEVWNYETPQPLAMLGRHILEPRWLAAYKNIPTVTVSESSARSLEEYGLANVKVVAEGHTPRNRPNVPREPQPTAIFVGRLSPNKRPGDAIEAFRILESTMPQARLWVVGTGQKERTLHKKAPGNVTFHGRVGTDYKFELIARAHVLVATSVREGWGLVVTEAAEMGTPAICYDVPGLRDSCNASGGLLIRDDPKALAESLSDHLEAWMTTPPKVAAGGVVSWNDVATSIIDFVSHQSSLSTNSRPDSRVQQSPAGLDDELHTA